MNQTLLAGDHITKEKFHYITHEKTHHISKEKNFKNNSQEIILIHSIDAIFIQHFDITPTNISYTHTNITIIMVTNEMKDE